MEKLNQDAQTEEGKIKSHKAKKMRKKIKKE